ncbi:hypothetical protein KR009_006938 [Drosophila setifemur]|nr:hypothetical protein KR009_006938 [Drosophila setifemur]
MADVDELDTLSNADLRAKMMAQGLPNIPVTDSSRKVLVKRLRASLGGQASPAAASPKKSSNRRETLAPTAPSAPAAASTPVDKLDGGSKVAPATKARRTITAAAETKETKETKEPVARKPVTVAPPIQTRRPSTTEKREPARVARKPEPIEEEESLTSKRTNHHENTLEINSLIVLESDEEEDEQLARAADLVEKKIAYGDKPKPRNPSSTYEKVSAVEPPRRPAYEYSTEPTRRPAYESSSVVPPRRPTYESSVDPPRRPAYESSIDPPRRPAYESSVDPPRRPAYEISAAFSLNAASAVPSVKAPTSSSYDYLSSRTGRYSSYVRTPVQSYVTAEAPAPAPPATSSYTRTYANEMSDDNEPNEDAEYESTFAQNLARLRAERLGDRSSPYSRRTIASGTAGTGYGSLARRSLRPEDATVNAAFRRWCISLDQKYKLKPKLFILMVILLLIGVYKTFY